MFGAWVNQNADELEKATGLAAGVLSKYPGKLARIVLVLHLLRHPGASDGAIVSAQIVEDAIAVVEYLRAHLSKVLPTLGAAPIGRPAGLTGRISRKLQWRRREQPEAGWMTKSQISAALGGHTLADAYTASLDALVNAGRAEKRVESTLGRPRELWRWGSAEIRNKPEEVPAEEERTEG